MCSSKLLYILNYPFLQLSFHIWTAIQTFGISKIIIILGYILLIKVTLLQCNYTFKY